MAVDKVNILPVWRGQGMIARTPTWFACHGRTVEDVSGRGHTPLESADPGCGEPHPSPCGYVNLDSDAPIRTLCRCPKPCGVMDLRVVPAPSNFSTATPMVGRYASQ